METPALLYLIFAIIFKFLVSTTVPKFNTEHPDKGNLQLQFQAWKRNGAERWNSKEIEVWEAVSMFSRFRLFMDKREFNLQNRNLDCSPN